MSPALRERLDRLPTRALALEHLAGLQQEFCAFGQAGHKYFNNWRVAFRKLSELTGRAFDCVALRDYVGLVDLEFELDELTKEMGIRPN